VVPPEATTEALGKALAGAGPLGRKRILLARADIATPGLAAALRDAGAVVEEAVAYRTVRPEALPAAAVEALRGGRVDWITFTSSSTVENFLALVAHGRSGTLFVPDAHHVKLAAIGPVTAETLRSRGLVPAVVARTHTIDGLVEAIVEFEKARGDR
jgi:uroporphyrinogen III methyltransferase/synthase